MRDAQVEVVGSIWYYLGEKRQYMYSLYVEIYSLSFFQPEKMLDFGKETIKSVTPEVFAEMMPLLRLLLSSAKL